MCSTGARPLSFDFSQVPIYPSAAALTHPLPVPQAHVTPTRAPRVQARLSAPTLGDALEGEAERVAAALDGASPPPATLAAATGAGGLAVDATFERHLARQTSGGIPLPSAVRARFEPWFGTDFSDVRVHADPAAAALNRQLAAEALTFQQHIFFNAGRYNPASAHGRRLLGHELTHVVQQGAAAPRVIQRRVVQTGDEVQQALASGWRSVRALPEATLRRASVEQRISLLLSVASAYWVGSEEEEAILRILSTTPETQAQALWAAMSSMPVAGGPSLAQRLDQVVDLGNNAALHIALSQLRINALGPERRERVLDRAPVLPWYDGLVEDITFKTSIGKGGKIRVAYAARAFVHLRNSRGARYELRDMPEGVFGQGHDFDPNDVIIIFDIETRRRIPVVAGELLGQERQYVRAFLTRATVAAATGVGAAVAITSEAATALGGEILEMFFGREGLIDGLWNVANNIVSQGFKHGTRWEDYNLESLPADYVLGVVSGRAGDFLFDRFPASLTSFASLRSGRFWRNFAIQQGVFWAFGAIVNLLRTIASHASAKGVLGYTVASNAVQALKSVLLQGMLEKYHAEIPLGIKDPRVRIANKIFDTILKQALQYVFHVTPTAQRPAATTASGTP